MGVVQVGDRVLAFTDFGAWSELVAVQSRFVYKMPPSMSFEDGAAMLMSYVTAYILLFDIGNLREGQSVLVHSAGGGVVSDVRKKHRHFLRLVPACLVFRSRPVSLVT